MSGWFADAAFRWWLVAVCLYSVSVSQAWWVWAAAIVVLGITQHAIVILGHHAAHRHVAARSWLNEAAGAICFWPLFVSLRSYRPFHFGHHARVGQPSDPELIAKNWTPHRWRADANRWWLFATDLIGFGIEDTLVVQWVFRPRRWRDVVGPGLTVAAAWWLLPW